MPLRAQPNLQDPPQPVAGDYFSTDQVNAGLPRRLIAMPAGAEGLRTWAEQIVVVNPDGTPITPGAGGGGATSVAIATAAPPAFAEGSAHPLSIDLAGALRIAGGGGGGGGVVQQGARDATAAAWYVSFNGAAQPITVATLPLPTNAAQEHVGSASYHAARLTDGTSFYDARAIRALTAADVVSISGAVAVTGTFWQATQPVSIAATVNTDVSDRTARVLGRVFLRNVADTANMGDATTPVRVDPTGTTAQPVTGTFWQSTQPVSIAAAVDVSDRPARLVGVVYGSQGQQLKQTATNFNEQVEIAVGATLVDPRAIRALTTAQDAVSIGQWIGSVAPTVGQKAMASSLPVVISSDQGAFPADTVGVTVALNALNAAAQVACSGMATVGFALAAGTLNASIVTEASYDGGANWQAINFVEPQTMQKASGLSFGGANAFFGRTIMVGGGITHVRVRVSAYTSGTANCTLRATETGPFVSIVSESTPGNSAPPAALMVGGTDGANLRTLSVDVAGRVQENIAQVGGTAVKTVPSGGVGQPAVPVDPNAIQLATYTFSVNGVASGALVANTRKDVVSIEHAAATTKTTKLRRVIIGGLATTAVAGTVEIRIFRGTAASSAGTAVTAMPTNPATAAPGANDVVVKTLPTITAATGPVYTYFMGVVPATANSAVTTQVVYDWQEVGGTQPFTLRSGTLDTLVIAIQSSAAINVTLYATLVVTEE